MPALLREDLVLDLHGGGAGAFEQAHRALHVERIAEAGVDVDDERQGAHVADPRRGLGELGHGQEPKVGHAELRVGDAGAGQIDRLVAEILDNARNQRVGGAGHQQRPPLLDELTKRRAALGFGKGREIGLAAVLHRIAFRSAIVTAGMRSAGAGVNR